MNAMPKIQFVEERTLGPVALAAPKRAIRKRSSRFADPAFRVLVGACSVSLLVIAVLIFLELLNKSQLSIHQFGLRFFIGLKWNPVSGEFGALPFIYGTLVSSLVALIIAVPLALGSALFITEICPKRLKSTVSFLLELLAAIPSVIYGLWGIFALSPLLRQYVEPWLASHFGWTGLFDGPPFGIGMLAAGVILAIMIIPIIGSIAREVVLAVPSSQREGVLALGATRWETVLMAVLRNARTGILGGVILGLGRALGETIAVTMVIGNTPQIAKSLLAPGYSLASVIANEFSEATGDLYLSSLFEIGLALFLITLVVNGLARLLVWSVTRGMPARASL